MYHPGRMPRDVENIHTLLTYLEDELDRISQHTIDGKSLVRNYEKTSVLPVHPKDGDVVYFDTDIVTPTPTVAGIYAYIGTTWTLMS